VLSKVVECVVLDSFVKAESVSGCDLRRLLPMWSFSLSLSILGCLRLCRV
jgi:hypothetical protein